MQRQLTLVCHVASRELEDTGSSFEELSIKMIIKDPMR